MPSEWPLVGRDAEVVTTVARFRDPEGRGVLLAGAAGVGKTRLALECAGRLDEGGGRVVEVRASRSAATIPLGALAPVLPDTASDGAQGLRETVEALAALRPNPGRLVLLVDDVHALDDASATVVHQVATSTDTFVIATLRTGEPAPDAVTALWKDELVERIDLGPLDEPGVESVLATVLGGPIDGAVVRQLYEASGGNLLYLRELVRGLLESATLNDRGGLWHFDGPVVAPPRVVELIGARLEQRDALERRGLAAVALAEPCDLDVMLAVVDPVALEGLERDGLVQIHLEGDRRVVTAGHPLYAEVARASMPELVVHQVGQELADALESAGMRRGGDARRVALMRLDAGEPADPEALLAAARSARSASDYETTIRLAAVAWERGRLPVAGQLLGESLDATGHHAEAEEVMAEAMELATDEAELTAIGLSRTDNLFRGLARAEQAEALTRELAARVGDAERRDLCVAHEATFRVLQGRIDDTIELARPLLDRPDDDRAYCQGALPVATALVFKGRCHEAIDISRRAFEVRLGFGGDDVQLSDAGVYLVSLAMAQLEAGQIDAGLATATAGYDGALQARNRAGQAWFASAVARGHALAGRLTTAARIAQEVAVAFEQIAHPATRWGLGGMVLFAAQLGDASRAQLALAELEALDPTPVLIMDTELVARGRAWLRAAEGELPDARGLLVDAADQARAVGATSTELAMLHDVARLGDAAGVRDRAARCTAAIEGDLAPARLAAIESLADGDPDALAAAADRFESIGGRLLAAEVANEAAVRARAAGEGRSAAALARRARTLAADCEGARTPLLEAGTDVAVLTRREREVATLAASGLASKEIADRLVVSRRTVENHLQRAYEKLGVRGRAELADALGRAGY